MNRFLFKTATLALSVFAVSSMAQDGNELALAKETLAELQFLSFKNDIEYCGYLVFDDSGAISATTPVAGKQAECTADIPPDGFIEFASYHTHGAASDEGSFELPSYSDAEGDEEEGIDGYVATPGGRLWSIDSTERTINLICDLKCLPQDPNFIEYPEERPNDFYTYEELRKQELEDG